MPARWWNLTLFLSALFFLARPAQATGVSATDGNELLRKCNTNIRTIDTGQVMTQSDYVDGAFCVGYVTGVIDDHFLWQINDQTPTDPSKHFCLPDGVVSGQAVRVVVKWLQSHPSRLQRSIS